MGAFTKTDVSVLLTAINTERWARGYRAKHDEPRGVGKGFTEEVTFDLDPDSEVGVCKVKFIPEVIKAVHVDCMLAHLKSIYRKILIYHICSL